MKKILVTGSAGFSGKHLMKYLQSFKYLEVIGVDKNNIAGDIQCDLLQLTDIDNILKKIKPDYIIHLAGINKSDDFRQYYNINLFPSINLLEAVVRNGLFNSHILLISSSAVYGLSSDNPVKENSPLNPITFYGSSKRAMENTAKQYIRNYDLHLNIVRPFNIIGPGQPHSMVVPAFLEQLLKIKSSEKAPLIKVGNLSALRDFIDIHDVVRAYWKILNTDVSGQIYNIGTSVPTKIDTILSKLIKLVNVDVKIEYDKHRRQKHDVPVQTADITKILKLGWKPQIDLDTSLKNLVAKNIK